MSLTCNITPVKMIDENIREEMFTLFTYYFDNVKRESFFTDLNEKDWIIIQKDQDGHLAGFSTIQKLQTDLNGIERTFLYSGDTIVAPEFWHSSMLIGAFGHFMLRMINESNTPLYWLLISKGFRTYRFLPVFFNSFFPSYNGSTASELRGLRDLVGRHKFGGAYDPVKGVVSYNGKRDRLKEGLCTIPDGRSHNPHVRFFLMNNPGYRQGDELVCLAEISVDNLNRCAQRAIRSAKVNWDG